MPSKVLIATTCRWFSTARLAVAFSRAGCVVEVVCSSDHPVFSASTVQKIYPYHELKPLRSFRAAMLSSRADLVVPCDDLAMMHFHRLYNQAVKSGRGDSDIVRKLIEVSLGDPAGYPITESRDAFMAMIYTLGICAPETKTIFSIEEVEEWLSKFGFPAVLKADGTSGGEGVRIVHTLEEARCAYRTLHVRGVPAMVVAKRAILDRDLHFATPRLWQRRRSVSIQSFVTGPDANIAAACWQGEILSSISVEVLQTWQPKGPATIARLIQNNEMLHAAQKILRRLKFSGLCGFDFIIDKATGNASLIEMNARATQTAPLPLGPGRDPVASLSSMVTGRLQYGTAIDLRGDTIALFPLAWRGDTSSEMFQSAYHDIPWEEPELVRLGMKQARDLPYEKCVRLFSKMGYQELQ